MIVFRDVAAHIINLFSPLTAQFFFAGARTSQDIWRVNAEKDALIYKMMREWDSLGLDAVISCSFPLPAVAPEYCSKVIAGNGCPIKLINP